LRFDVAVIGGGPAGSSAALFLARHGARVALIDGRAQSDFSAGESLSSMARSLFARLGLETLLVPHFTASGGLSAWGGPDPLPASAVISPYGGGWHLDRRKFDADFLAFASDSGAKVMKDARYLKPIQTGLRNTLRVEVNGEFIDVVADYIVDASGRRACYSVAHGARRNVTDKLIAVWGVASSTCLDKDDFTMIDACEDGWYYSARISDRLRVFAIFGDGDLLDLRSLRTEIGFRQRISLSTVLRQKYTQNAYALVQGPKMSNASSGYMTPPIGDNWISVGDAALSVDPLSAEGILFAVVSGHNAATTLLEIENGNGNSAFMYADFVRQHLEEYRSKRRAYYRLETRWRDSAFWERRQLGNSSS